MQPSVRLMPGDNRISLAELPENSIDAVVTDPPYSLTSITKRFGKAGSKAARRDAGKGNDGSFSRVSGGFMGKTWDATGIERDPEFWAAVYRVLKPGGFVFAFSGARTGHWQAVAMEQAGFIMHPMHAWIYGCMDPETECLTRRGWSKYWEIAEDDEVLQWDSATGELSWVRPHAVHEYPFDGEMVVIENRHTRQVLTPNHRVYAKVRRHGRHPKPTTYEVVEAGEIDRRSAAWRVDLPLAGRLKQGDWVDLDYAYLVGWWLTDAWAHRDANACCFSQSKPETLARLRAALEPHGASEYVKSAKKESHNDEHSFYLTGPIADRLRAEFPDRALPWSVLGWCEMSRRRLYAGLMDGDGSQQEGNAYAHTFWSKDQERRDVFMALALSLGMRCYEDAAKGAVYVNTTRHTTQIQNRHRSARMPHTGMVWCLTVPTGAFVVRRDGKPFITGNSGFPKGHDASKAIDRHLGTLDRREVVGARYEARRFAPGATVEREGGYRKREAEDGNEQTFVATDEIGGSAEARAWDGWKYGTQTQKPAMEPIYLGQKPYDGKPVESILKWGVGAFNIDGCRVPYVDSGDRDGARPQGRATAKSGALAGGTQNDNERVEFEVAETSGRYPANVLHDGSDAVVALFPESKGQQGDLVGHSKGWQSKTCYGDMPAARNAIARGDSGSAARFFNAFPPDETPWPVAFYHAKAGKTDRRADLVDRDAGEKPHPTVKPIGLLRHLVRHVCPPGGTVLDPFGGTGTTAEAARLEGMNAVLMEAEPEYIAFLRRRFDLDTEVAPDPGSPADDLLALLDGDVTATVSADDDLGGLLDAELIASDNLDDIL